MPRTTLSSSDWQFLEREVRSLLLQSAPCAMRCTPAFRGVDTAKNEMNAKIRPYFMRADGKTPKAIKVVYDWGGWFVNQSLTNTITLPFLVMQLASSIEILHRIYFIPHLVILGSLVVLKVLPTPGAKKKKAE